MFSGYEAFFDYNVVIISNLIKIKISFFLSTRWPLTVGHVCWPIRHDVCRTGRLGATPALQPTDLGRRLEHEP